MSFLYPGEYLIHQFDDVTVSKPPNTWCLLWHNFSYLSKSWKSKVTMKQELSASFSATILLSNFRFIAVKNAENIFNKVANNEPLQITVYLQLPLFHVRSCYRTSNTSQVILNGILPFQLSLLFKSAIPAQVHDLFSQLNSCRPLPSIFAFHHSLSKKTFSEKVKSKPQVEGLSLDPLSKGATKTTLTAASGLKILTLKPEFEKFQSQWLTYFDCFEGFEVADLHVKLLAELVQQQVKSEAVNLIRTNGVNSVPFENFQALQMPMSQILPFSYFLEKQKFEQNIQVPHLSFKNLNYNVCQSYPAVFPVVTEDIVKYAKHFQFCRYPSLVGTKLLRCGKLLELDQNLKMVLYQSALRLKCRNIVVFQVGDSGFVGIKLAENCNLQIFDCALPSLDQLQASYTTVLNVNNQQSYHTNRSYLPESQNLDEYVDEMTNFIQKTQKIQRDLKNNQQLETSGYNFYVNQFLATAAKLRQYGAGDDLCVVSGTLERFYGPVLLLLSQLMSDPEARKIFGFIKAFKLHFQMFGFPLASLCAETPHKQYISLHGHSLAPIMQLVADCIFKVMSLNSNSFGFSQDFIRHFILDLFNGQYGDFLFDSEVEAVSLGIPTITESLMSAPTKKFEKYITCEEELEDININELDVGAIATDGVLCQWVQGFLV